MQLEFQVLTFATLGLVAFGLVMVFSATSASAMLGGESASAYLVRQGIYAASGLAGMIVLSRFDYRLLRRMAPSLLAIGLVLCALVLVAGVQVNGARRWLTFGPITLQPSELLKLALAIWVPARLAHRKPPATIKELARPVGLFVGAACALIMLEPDLGTVITVLLTVSAALLVLAVPFSVMNRAGAIVGSLGVVAVLLEPYQRARVDTFIQTLLHPLTNAQGSGYQTMQSLIGMGSGGPLGRGLGEGVQKIHFLPEAHTDMIASVIGEELGFIGIVALIACYGAFAWAGLRIARSCRDPFGKAVAASLTAMICGQAAINLAAVLGLAPLTGIPLPFVSYGGSSLVVSLLAAGILLNIAVNHGRTGQDEMRDRRRRDSRASHARARGR